MYLNGLVYCKYLTVSVHVTNKVPLLHFQVEPKKKVLLWQRVQISSKHTAFINRQMQSVKTPTITRYSCKCSWFVLKGQSTKKCSPHNVISNLYDFLTSAKHKILRKRSQHFVHTIKVNGVQNNILWTKKPLGQTLRATEVKCCFGPHGHLVCYK